MSGPEARSASPSPGRRARAIAVAGVMLVAVVLTGVAVAPGPERAPWEVPSSPAAIGLYALTTAVLAVSAVVVTAQPAAPRSRLSAGTALVVLTLTWAILVVFGRLDAPAWLRLVAIVLAALGPAALLHLSAAVGRWPHHRARVLVTAGYLACALPALARAVVTEPFRDPFCRAGCEAPGIVLLDSVELTGAFGLLLLGASCVVAGAALLIALVGAVRHSGSPTVLAAVVPVAVVDIALSLTPTARPGLGTLAQYGEALFMARCVATILLAFALILDAASRARRLARVRALMRRLPGSAEAGSLQTVLRDALRDPGLRVDYWLPSLSAWAESSGRKTPPSTSSDDTLTIARGGSPVARVTVRRAFSLPDLESVVGAAARLVIDNERLRVELLAQERELRASRLRGVEAADTARRRLERDLHDGAQQRLIAASYSLRLAASEASGGVVVAEAERRLARVLGVLAALRDVARGVYPPVLADAGLVPALEALARSEDAHPFSLAARPSPFPRLDPAIELTAYLTVREAAVGDASSPLATALELSDGRLRLTMEQTGPAPAERVADRIAALGGTLSAEGGKLSMEVPCE